MNWGPARDMVWTSTLHARQPQQRVRELRGGWGLFVLSGFPRRNLQSVYEQEVYWGVPGTPACAGEGG